MNKRLAIVTLIVVLTVFVLVSPTYLSAQYEKKSNIIGSLGFAVSDYEGLVMDIGAEFQLTKAFFVQFLFDYYLDPLEEDLEPSIGNVDFSAFGLNLYGVFKVSPSERLNLFAKAGIHYTTLKASTKIQGLLNIAETDSDIGVAGGIGFEYLLNERWGIVLGGTGKLLFAGDTLNWFKIYGGVSFRVR